MAKQKNSKSNTSNLFNRYVWLVDLIYSREKITFEEINDIWSRATENGTGEDLPLRTFHNHRQAIQQMFQIDIGCDRRNGYAYFIEDREGMEKAGVRTWLLNTFAVNRLINESHKLKSRILFEQIPSGQRFLAPIIESMRDEKTIEITYQSFWRDRPNTFEVEPYCVKVFKQRWYLVARSPYYNAIRIYSLDRIQNLHITDTTCKLPPDFDPEAFFTFAFGIIVDESVKPCTVKLKVFGNQQKYLQTLPLHPSQQEIEKAEEYSIFTCFIAPTFDFKQEILSHGDLIEVLSPAWFREEVAEISRNMSKLYTGLL